MDIRKGDITDAQFISEIDAGKYDAAVASLVKMRLTFSPDVREISRY
ncbi:MAG: hypothetical protein Ct9H90mP11_09370 [Acidimicrobiales bacterium]|nr:MAG: hypothetical protein Ct9H90mP11_09370 [Acidimicrobiales bacterium]